MSSPQPRPRRRWLRRFAALCVGLVVAALAFELGVRLFLGEQPKFPRHVVGAPWGLRMNQPGSRYRHKSEDVSIEFRIDAQGMRDERDHPYAKPAGVKRIVALGDSFTIGYEVEESACFARVLERELRARGMRVEVLNAGVSGFSTAEECLYLERELYKYEPDLVLLTFFENDLVDNLRTGLFELDGETLRAASETYIPAGRLANALNTNGVLSWLSETSDSFCLVKEGITKLAKERMVEEHALETQPNAQQAAALAEAERVRQRKLAGAILERIYAGTRQRGIPFVIQSIPFPAEDGSKELVDKFPAAEFDVRRPGLAFLSMRDVLQPHFGKTLLYWTHSHSHWTPFAHEQSGKALAELFAREQLLR